MQNILRYKVKKFFSPLAPYYFYTKIMLKSKAEAIDHDADAT